MKEDLKVEQEGERLQQDEEIGVCSNLSQDLLQSLDRASDADFQLREPGAN